MRVDLLVFEVGAVAYAADLGQVLRVDRPVGPPSVGTPLGVPGEARRSLVFALGGSEHRLDVDQVRGVVSVSSEALRRLPPTVRAPPMVLGALIEEKHATVLIDLHAIPLSLRGPDGERLS